VEKFFVLYTIRGTSFVTKRSKSPGVNNSLSCWFFFGWGLPGRCGVHPRPHGVL